MTTVIVTNDALDQIENDPAFGKKLAAAIRLLSGGLRPTAYGWDVTAGGHSNAATVIETHHSDSTTLVAVGGGIASVLASKCGYRHQDPAFRQQLLKEALAENAKSAA